MGVLRHDGLAVLHPAELIHQHPNLLRVELQIQGRGHQTDEEIRIENEEE